MDVQYKFLKKVCRMSNGVEWVSYSQLAKSWRRCPKCSVLLNLADNTYVTAIPELDGVKFFPLPEAFSYVRQRKDSTRNLIVTVATLVIAAFTLALQL